MWYNVSMKGITDQLRNLAIGEQIEVHGTQLANLYMLARRLKIKISAEKFVGGFCVTRIPSERPKAPAKMPTDNLSAFIAAAREKKGLPAEIVPDNVPVDEWAGWSEPRQARDDEASEIIHYREHIKTGKRSILSRETAW